MKRADPNGGVLVPGQVVVANLLPGNVLGGDFRLQDRPIGDGIGPGQEQEGDQGNEEQTVFDGEVFQGLATRRIGIVQYSAPTGPARTVLQTRREQAPSEGAIPTAPAYEEGRFRFRPYSQPIRVKDA